jgi:hypothetical protein
MYPNYLNKPPKFQYGDKIISKLNYTMWIYTYRQDNLCTINGMSYKMIDQDNYRLAYKAEVIIYE